MNKISNFFNDMKTWNNPIRKFLFWWTLTFVIFNLSGITACIITNEYKFFMINVLNLIIQFYCFLSVIKGHAIGFNNSQE